MHLSLNDSIKQLDTVPVGLIVTVSALSIRRKSKSKVDASLLLFSKATQKTDGLSV